MKKLNSIDDNGKINMIFDTNGSNACMEADASGFIQLKSETIKLIKENEAGKGDLIKMAQLSGIKAAGTIRNLIPLDQEVILNSVDVKASIYPNGIEVKSYVKSPTQSGVEIEALSAVSVALMTIYEICKNVDGSMQLSDVKIFRKSS